MKRYGWLKLLKKSRPEPELEPPFWLGDHSNGEYYHRQTPRERLIRRLILERADEGARKHGIDRRQFLASSMGVATSLSVINWVAACSSKETTTGAGPIGAGGEGGLGSGGAGGGAGTGATASGAGGGVASNAGSSATAGAGGASAGTGGMAAASGSGAGGVGGVGGTFEVGDPIDPECTAERMLDPNLEFVFDLQTHHIERIANSSYMSFFQLGYPEQSACGKGLPECFRRNEFIDQIFLKSHTSLAMLSAVPAVEQELPLSNDEIASTRDYVNELAHSQRVLIQGQVLPNDGLQRQLDGMQRLVEELGVVCWKVHTEWGPRNTWGNAPDGFWLDDEAVGIPFIEKAIETGVKVFCCHKGLPAPLFNAEHCSPRDIPPVAKMFPDTHWVAYHSAFGFGGGLFGGSEGAYQMGSTTGIDSLITAMKDNGVGPNQNVYAELAGVWDVVMTNPTVAAHVIGKLLLHVGEDNVLWGSDAIWTARPQPYVDAFWNFEITPQFQMQYGYPALTPEIKRKVLGLNGARLFGVDPAARRCAIGEDALTAARRAIEVELGPMYWIGQRPLGPTTRRAFMQLSRQRQARKVPG